MRVSSVDILYGEASFKDSHTISVNTKEGILEKRGKRIIIASGSQPIRLPIEGIELQGVINSDDALQIDKIPKEIVVIGSGAVGTELSWVLHNFGTKVTIVEMASQILPNFDEEISKLYTQHLEEEGIETFVNTKLIKIEKSGIKLELFFENKGKTMKLLTECALIASGRKAVTDNLNLQNAGIMVEKGVIDVNNKTLETNVKDIYAIGDVIGGIQLAHVAYAEAKVVANRCLGGNKEIDYSVVPICIYTKPEIASVGLTEKAAKSKGLDIRVVRYNMNRNGKASAMMQTKGLVKVVIDSKYGEILGIHLIGPEATEVIAEAAMALKLEATEEMISSIIHAHPTISEGISEALELA